MREITAIVTIYYPKQEHADNIKQLADQVDRVIICDNSPKCNVQLFDRIKNTKYYFFKKNCGLSAAFNIALRCEDLKWKDSDYVIFFDQDSKIERNHISILIEEFETLEKKKVKIGCLGPIFFNSSSNKIEIAKQKKKITDTVYEVSSIITSSMLCRYEDLKKIDFWNEEIFLDMADWDICWRFQKIGKQCCVTKKTTLYHSVGEGAKKIGPLRIRVGKPFREYYQTRDCLYLIKKRYVPIKYKVRFLGMLTLRPLMHALFLKDVKQRMYYIKRGICDYKKNIHGALQEQKDSYVF